MARCANRARSAAPIRLARRADVACTRRIRTPLRRTRRGDLVPSIFVALIGGRGSTARGAPHRPLGDRRRRPYRAGQRCAKIASIRCSSVGPRWAVRNAILAVLAQIPTVADLRERRLDLLRASVREALLEDDRDRLRPVIEPLLDEFDVVDVALAALGVAERAVSQDGVDEAEIAPASLPSRPVPRSRRAGEPKRGLARRPSRRTFEHRDRSRSETHDGRWTRLFVGGGRRAGIRPGDLVGAIAGEAGVTGESIGAIQIADGYSLVAVPDQAADDIVRALSSATIKGRRLPVRRER